MKVYTFAFLLAACPGLAFAQDSQCADAMAQAELNACVYAEFETADAALNKIWPQAMALMKQIDANLPKAEQGAADQLRDSQRAWITFRDANCAAEAYMVHGGSAQPMVRYGCMARLTEARTADLELLATQDF